MQNTELRIQNEELRVGVVACSLCPPVSRFRWGYAIISQVGAWGNCQRSFKAMASLTVTHGLGKTDVEQTSGKWYCISYAKRYGFFKVSVYI